DFSHPSTLENLLNYAIKNNVPCVISTTGYSLMQINQIENASKQIPIFFSANMSLGVCLLSELAKKAALFLGEDFDIEIVEKHHNQKIDAPSGTALMLGNEINSVCNNKYEYVYNRQSKREKRAKNEIGFAAIRGGTIVGEHDVIFAGLDEVITLSHSAYSKSIFATGSVNAAIFIKNKPAGLYKMQDILKQV
ncbi:MAG: 4-hydroxy-tetrahydrodipicolinate reductase, partial [Clostridia bacterium]